MIKTRFAPSPTGYLHVGGARTALFNFLFARAHGGKFVLRIEDTDQKRSTKEACDQVIASMEWLKLNWDEGPIKGGEWGPYFQSKRLAIYEKCLEGLLQKGLVYRCFCTDRELVEKKKRCESMGLPPLYDGKCRNLKDSEIQRNLAEGKPHTLRFKVEPREVIFDDLVRGTVRFDTKWIGDYVIRKSDGFPTYNFAVVVDDAAMEITHVIRGDDHISNTPRQILLYDALDFTLPRFCHVSTILGADKEKLSKRHGAMSVLEYKNAGYLPDPFNNFLALLGWSPKDGNEIIAWENLQKSFTDTKFSSSPSIFDTHKLDFLNGHYIRNHDENEIFEAFLPFLKKGPLANWFGASFFEKQSNILQLKRVVRVLKGYCKKLSEINEHLSLFYRDEIQIETEAAPHLETEDAPRLLDFCIGFLNERQQTGEETLSPDGFKAMMKGAKEELGVGGKKFFKPLRVALSGREQGVELRELFELLTIKSLMIRLRKVKADIDDHVFRKNSSG